MSTLYFESENDADETLKGLKDWVKDNGYITVKNLKDAIKLCCDIKIKYDETTEDDSKYGWHGAALDGAKIFESYSAFNPSNEYPVKMILDDPLKLDIPDYYTITVRTECDVDPIKYTKVTKMGEVDGYLNLVTDTKHIFIADSRIVSYEVEKE